MRKPNVKVSNLLIFLLPFSFSVMHHSKSIWCMWILYIPSNCSATGNPTFLFWGCVQAMTGKLWQQNILLVCKTFLFEDNRISDHCLHWTIMVKNIILNGQRLQWTFNISYVQNQLLLYEIPLSYFASHGISFNVLWVYMFSSICWVSVNEV